MAGPAPASALDVAPGPGCKTRRKYCLGGSTAASLRQTVLQPGAGCRVSPSWLSFSDNQVIC
jgi:hypothetical protein